MKILFILYFLTSIIASMGNTKAPSYGKNAEYVFKSDTNNKKEDRIIDSIAKLPEVIAREKYLYSLTNHKGHLSVVVAGKPNKSQRYYWIKVGYDSELHFETYYNFYVYEVGRNLEIKYYDVINGKPITLKEWRRNRKNEY